MAAPGVAGVAAPDPPSAAAAATGVPAARRSFSALEASFSEKYLCRLIIGQLAQYGHVSAAAAVAKETGINPAVSDAEFGRIPPNALAQLVIRGLEAVRSEERALQQLIEMANEQTFGGAGDDDDGRVGLGPLGSGGDEQKQAAQEGPAAAAASSAAADGEAIEPSAFPSYVCKYTAQHKDSVLCADISGDGQLAATGGADQCLKLLRVAHMHHHFQLQKDAAASAVNQPPQPQAQPQPQARDRAVAKNFIEHSGPILDLQFHPLEPVVASASQRTIKFFRHHTGRSAGGGGSSGAQSAASSAFQTLNTNFSVRSFQFHPSGDFLLVGTSHHMVRLYDISTFQCYLSSSPALKQHTKTVNSVRWNPSATLYASASADGSIKLWDGAGGNACTQTITRAHGGDEVISLCWNQAGDQLLSTGRDSTVRLWDVGTGKCVREFLGATQKDHKSTAAFAFGERHILANDELSHDLIVWDALTGAKVQSLAGHTSNIQCISVSTFEPAFITGSRDKRVRFWALDSGGL